uniref:Ovule protein n=1 Tax=Angiostrongylus cantonensis TaxID=6313 RepID=A0A0K0DNZ6_ANGCA
MVGIHTSITFKCMYLLGFSENGLGPKLLGVFPGGRFEEFIPSRPLEHDEVAHPRISSLLARILPRFHSTTVPIAKRPNILKLMREWLTLFEEQGNFHVQIQSTSFHLHTSDFKPLRYISNKTFYCSNNPEKKGNQRMEYFVLLFVYHLGVHLHGCTRVCPFRHYIHLRNPCKRSGISYLNSCNHRPAGRANNAVCCFT